MNLKITNDLIIPISEFHFKFVRSSGPGGQNVNKVNSKAVLTWSIFESRALKDEHRAILLNKLENVLNREGELVVSSDQYRDQLKNKKTCLLKLEQLLKKALYKKKIRKKTKPSKSSIEKIKKQKISHAQKKRSRNIKKYIEGE